MNRIILLGNLTRDPELKIVGTSNVCNFGIAVNRQVRSQAGTRQETTFIDIEAWGKTAENIAKYFNKGKPILIEGRLKLDEWQDTTSGQRRSKLKAVAERFYFCGGNQGGGQQQGQQQQDGYHSNPAPQTQNYPQPTPQAPAAPKSPFVGG